MGLIHDIPTCDVLLKRIEREAIDALQRTTSLITDSVTPTTQRGKEVVDPDANPQSDHGSVGKGVNNPEAEIWGIGQRKSKL